MQSMPLPDAWVKSLFGKFAAMYGEKFASQWRNVPESEIVSVWSEALGPYADDGEHRGSRIKWALMQLRDNNPFPPTLPEFVQLVRQAPRPQPAALPAPKVSPDVAKDRADQIAQAAKKAASKQQDPLAWAKRADLVPRIPGSAWESMLIRFAREDEQGMRILRAHVDSGVRFSARVDAFLSQSTGDSQ